MGRPKGVRIIDKIDQLIDRLNKNMSDYNDHIKGFAKEQIIEMAGRINAMSDAHTYMTQHHGFDYEQAEYLLQFKNPLEIVADKWETRISDLSDMSFDLDKVFYDQDAATNGYELADTDTVTPAENAVRENSGGKIDMLQRPSPLGKAADVQDEAERIVAAFKELAEPNSPNKTHFAVPLSREFMYLASSKDHDRLLDALPYKSKALTGINGEKGIFVTVPKDELQKPSIMGQLAVAKKEATARPKAVEQSKKHDKEAR